MRGLIIAFVVAALLGTAACFVVHHLYTSGRVTIDISDGQGHGPDHGSEEWREAAQRAILFRPTVAGGVAFVVLLSIRRRAED